MLELAIKGMLPKNSLAAKCLRSYMFMRVANIRIKHNNLKYNNFVDFLRGGIFLAQVQYIGTGRRKSSVARVRLVPGTGEIVINDLKLQPTSHSKHYAKLLNNH